MTRPRSSSARAASDREACPSPASKPGRGSDPVRAFLVLGAKKSPGRAGAQGLSQTTGYGNADRNSSGSLSAVCALIQSRASAVSVAVNSPTSGSRPKAKSS